MSRTSSTGGLSGASKATGGAAKKPAGAAKEAGGCAVEGPNWLVGWLVGWLAGCRVGSGWLDLVGSGWLQGGIWLDGLFVGYKVRSR